MLIDQGTKKAFINHGIIGKETIDQGSVGKETLIHQGSFDQPKKHCHSSTNEA